MNVIRFRRLNRPIQKVNGVRIVTKEIAFSEDELFAKLNGEMAEIEMPAKPWRVQLWRVFFPPKAIEMECD